MLSRTFHKKSKTDHEPKRNSSKNTLNNSKFSVYAASKPTVLFRTEEMVLFSTRPLHTHQSRASIATAITFLKGEK